MQPAGDPVPCLLETGKGVCVCVCVFIHCSRGGKQNEECPHYLHNTKTQDLPVQPAISQDIRCCSLALCDGGGGLKVTRTGHAAEGGAAGAGSLEVSLQKTPRP